MKTYRITWSRTGVAGPDGEQVHCVETLRTFAGRLLHMVRQGQEITVHHIERAKVE